MTTLRRGVASAARQSVVTPSIKSAVTTSSVATVVISNQSFVMRGDGRCTEGSGCKTAGRGEMCASAGASQELTVDLHLERGDQSIGFIGESDNGEQLGVLSF